MKVSRLIKAGKVKVEYLKISSGRPVCFVDPDEVKAVLDAEGHRYVPMVYKPGRDPKLIRKLPKNWKFCPHCGNGLHEIPAEKQA